MSKVTNTSRSTPRTQPQRERQTNTISTKKKKTKKKKKTSRAGNPFPKKVATLLPKLNNISLTYIIVKRKKHSQVEHYRTFNKKKKKKTQSITLEQSVINYYGAYTSFMGTKLSPHPSSF